MERDTYFDFIKGIAIIFVVLIHVFGCLYEYESINFFILIVRNILNCAVPIFCFTSAYFISQKDFSIKHNRRKVFNQIIRVYVPYCFCSLPYFILDIKNNHNIVFSIIKYITCYYNIYYFVILIIQFYILYSSFGKKLFFKEKLLFIINLLVVLILTYYLDSKFSLPLVLFAGPVVCWCIFFSQGTKQSDSVKRHNLFVYIGLCILTLFLSVGETYFLIDRNKSLVGVGIKPSSILFSFFVMGLLFSCGLREKYISKNGVVKLFEIVGRYSYGIYLTHFYLILIANKFFRKYLKPNILLWIIFSSLIIFINCVCLFCVKKISKKISKFCFGVI